MPRLISEIQNGVNNGSIKPEINSRFISDNANKAMYMSVVDLLFSKWGWVYCSRSFQLEKAQKNLPFLLFFPRKWINVACFDILAHKWLELFERDQEGNVD